MSNSQRRRVEKHRAKQKNQWRKRMRELNAQPTPQNRPRLSPISAAIKRAIRS